MTIVIVSILVITVVIRLADRVLGWKICPICAGVSLTWIGMLIAREFGYSIDPSILAMLIGGSVVGIAYQMEKKLPANRSPLLWKSLFITSGFVISYGLVYAGWAVVIGALVWTLLLTYAFFRRFRSSAASSKKVEELKKKMEQCC